MVHISESSWYLCWVMGCTGTCQTLLLEERFLLRLDSCQALKLCERLSSPSMGKWSWLKSQVGCIRIIFLRGRILLHQSALCMWWVGVASPNTRAQIYKKKVHVTLKFFSFMVSGTSARTIYRDSFLLKYATARACNTCKALLYMS